MNNWTVKFETHSRDDVMKVCALLAKGIGHDTVTHRRVQSQIFGSYSGGKTAITDGLTAAFADDHSSYKLASKPLLEDYRGHAIDVRRIIKEFNIGGMPCDVSMSRTAFAIKDNFFNKAASYLFDKPSGRGLDFVTSTFKRKLSSDIEISFKRPNEREYEAHDWARQWEICIKDEKLRTPEMKEILDHLKNFHDRRQMRLAANVEIGLEGV